MAIIEGTLEVSEKYLAEPVLVGVPAAWFLPGTYVRSRVARVGLQFCFGNFLFRFGIRVLLVLANEFGSVSSSSAFPENIVKNQCSFFQCLIGFSNENIWAKRLHLGEF